MQNNFLYSNSKAIIIFKLNQPQNCILYHIVNVRVNLDKSLDEDVFDTIKTTIGYPLKSAWKRISYTDFCQLPQTTKK